MFAKGKIRGSGAQLARYLMTGEESERVELIDTHGLEAFGPDPIAAFAMMQDVADANTRSTKPFFHGHIRLPADERLTDAQWRETLDIMEKRVGFEGQPRIATFHIDRESGDKHLHVGWFRIDLETMRAIDPGLYKNDLRELCREQELAYGLRQLDNERQPHDRAPAAAQNETEESRRLGTNVREIRAAVLYCLEHSDNGRAFNAALEERGMMLANGDRRDCFVVIDQEGGHHALNKKLTGMTLAETRTRFSDLDRSQLPSVEQAQEMQRDRHSQVERATQPGQQQEIESQFAAASSRVTEPSAPVYDRDAAEVAWQRELIDRAAAQAEQAARAAARGRSDDTRGPLEGRQQPEQAASSNAPPEAPAAVSSAAADHGAVDQTIQPPPAPERITRPEEWLTRGRYDALRAEHQKAQGSDRYDTAEIASPTGLASPEAETAPRATDHAAQGQNSFLRSLGTWVTNFIDRLTGRDAPSLAPDEIVRQVRTEEQVQQQGSEEAERQRQTFEDWRQAEQRRQEEQEADPRLAAMMKQHMQPSARRHNDLYRETERDRD